MIGIILSLIFFGFMVYRTKPFMFFGLSPAPIILIFSLRLFFGVWFTSEYDASYGISDMKKNYNDVYILCDVAKESPSDFLRVFCGLNAKKPSIDSIMHTTYFWFDKGHSPWLNDSRNVIRLHVLLSAICNRSIFMHIFWANVLSMLGLLFLLKAFFGSKIPVWSLVVCLFPNCIAWSTVLLKEHIFILGMGFTFYSLSSLIVDSTKQNRLKLIAGLIVMSFVKSFWLLILLPGLFPFLFMSSRKVTSHIVLLSYLISTGLVAVLSGDFIPDFLFGQLRNAWRNAVFNQAGSILSPIIFSPDWFSLIKHAPEAFFRGLSQPHVSGLKDFKNLFFATENIALGLIILISCIMRIKFRFLFSSINTLAFIFASIIISISTITTPVAGNLIRYRMPGFILYILIFFSAIFLTRQARKKRFNHNQFEVYKANEDI